MEKTHAGTQSVEVGFGLLDLPACAVGRTMVRDLALAAGMFVATAHCYTVSFQCVGLLLQHADSTLYRLGCRQSAAPATAG